MIVTAIAVISEAFAAAHPNGRGLVVAADTVVCSIPRVLCEKKSATMRRASKPSPPGASGYRFFPGKEE
jgi:hypothetical protein